MKTNSFLEKERISNILKFFSSLFLIMLLISCSSDSVNTDQTEADLQNADLKGFAYETWQDQIARLDQKMRRFENFQVAMAQGWDVDGSGYVPNMGHHYINGEYTDDKFELLKPEALLYIPDGNGGWEFVGVEYLVFGIGPEGPAPEGFIGDEDVWSYNPNVPAWTLHAWVGLENPDGVFAAFNPDVPASSE